MMLMNVIGYSGSTYQSGVTSIFILGEGMLIGLVHQVTLKLGRFTTYVVLWVGDKLPFDMLLGLKWLTNSLVSIG